MAHGEDLSPVEPLSAALPEVALTGSATSDREICQRPPCAAKAERIAYWMRRRSLSRKSTSPRTASWLASPPPPRPPRIRRVASMRSSSVGLAMSTRYANRWLCGSCIASGSNGPNARLVVGQIGNRGHVTTRLHDQGTDSERSAAVLDAPPATLVDETARQLPATRRKRASAPTQGSGPTHPGESRVDARRRRPHEVRVAHQGRQRRSGRVLRAGGMVRDRSGGPHRRARHQLRRQVLVKHHP